MKLRLRSLETKQTHRIEVPDPCLLHQLKQILFHTLYPQNPSSSSIENLHLSLNRQHELQSSSPNEEETLQSLGITSGDLIFFTLNPSGFSTQISQITLNPSPNLQSQTTPPQYVKPTSDETQNSENALGPTTNVRSKGTQDEELIEKEEKVVDEEDFMEVDDDVSTYEGNVGKSFSVPGFLRKVFTEELGGDGGRDHELLVIAVHAVLLESGFVGFDPVLKTEIKGFQFRNNWPAGLFTLSLYYTLPEMITQASEKANTVVLKFHSLSMSLTVYGSLSNPKSVVHRVNFDENKLVPFLNVAWANCGMGDEISVGEGVSGTSAEKEVFEFWRNVKDRLALPLLIDLCEKGSLMLPACFIRLPTELKLKILEFLPGVDVAKVSCVCSELRYLSSSDDLWKKKYAEQFGDAERAGEGRYWKQKFVNCWESRKRRRTLSRVSIRRAVRPLIFPSMPPIVGGDHDIWPHLGVIGGDYDRLPQPLGGIPPGLVGGLPPGRRHRLPSHVPRCNLGGSGDRTFI